MSGMEVGSSCCPWVRRTCSRSTRRSTIWTLHLKERRLLSRVKTLSSSKRKLNRFLISIQVLQTAVMLLPLCRLLTPPHKVASTLWQTTVAGAVRDLLIKVWRWHSASRRDSKNRWWSKTRSARRRQIEPTWKQGWKPRTMRLLLTR